MRHTDPDWEERRRASVWKILMLTATPCAVCLGVWAVYMFSPEDESVSQHPAKAPVLQARDESTSESSRPQSGLPFEKPTLRRSSTRNAGVPELKAITIVDHQVGDLPDWGKLIFEAVLQPGATGVELRGSLLTLFEWAKKQDPFSYSDHPSLISIKVWKTEKHMARQPVVANLNWSRDLRKGDVSIYIPEALNKLWRPPEHRWGLSEARRREIWRALVKAEDKAEMEAKARYPLPDLFDGVGDTEQEKRLYEERFDKQGKLIHELRDKFRRAVREQYGITEKQATAISTEASEENWLFPAAPEGFWD